MRTALFLTLTYRRQHVEPDECKRNLKAFIATLRRNYPNSSGIWKLEFQERGTPHYHLLVFEKFIDHTWVAESWSRIAESSHPDHVRAGTQVKRVHDRASAGAYIGKYMGKLADGRDIPGDGPHASYGRFWGTYNRDRLPISEPVIIPLDGARARQIIGDALQSINRHRADHMGEFSIFTSGIDDTSRTCAEIFDGVWGGIRRPTPKGNHSFNQTELSND